MLRNIYVLVQLSSDLIVTLNIDINKFIIKSRRKENALMIRLEVRTKHNATEVVEFCHCGRLHFYRLKKKLPEVIVSTGG